MGRPKTLQKFVTDDQDGKIVRQNGKRHKSDLWLPVLHRHVLLFLFSQLDRQIDKSTKFYVTHDHYWSLDSSRNWVRATECACEEAKGKDSTNYFRLHKNIFFFFRRGIIIKGKMKLR